MCDIVVWNSDISHASRDPSLFFFLHTHRPCSRPKTTLFAWASSLMRRGRGGGGHGSSSTSRCAESCCFTSPPPPSSAVLPSPRVPALTEISDFDEKCQHFWYSSCPPPLLLQPRRGDHSRAAKREVYTSAAAQETADPRFHDPARHLRYIWWIVCVWGELSSTSVKFYRPREDSTSARHHDSEILCHLRHRDRVRSPPDSGDRPGRGSSLPNNDTQPTKKGELCHLSVQRRGVHTLSHSSHLSRLRVLNVSSAAVNRAHSASHWQYMRGVIRSSSAFGWIISLFTSTYNPQFVFRYILRLRLSGTNPEPPPVINPRLCSVQVPLHGDAAPGFGTSSH